MYMGLHLPLRGKKLLFTGSKNILRIYKGGNHKYSHLPDLSSLYADALHPEGSIRSEF